MDFARSDSAAVQAQLDRLAALSVPLVTPSVSTSGRKNASSTTSRSRSSNIHAMIAHRMPPPMLQRSHGIRMRKLSHAVRPSAWPTSSPSVWNTWRTRSRSTFSSCSRAYFSAVRALWVW